MRRVTMSGKSLTRLTLPILIVAGALTLTLGAYLGFGMYRLDLAAPISLQLATKVAAELTTSTAVDFAEPNGRVSTQISTR